MAKRHPLRHHLLVPWKPRQGHVPGTARRITHPRWDRQCGVWKVCGLCGSRAGFWECGGSWTEDVIQACTQSQPQSASFATVSPQ